MVFFMPYRVSFLLLINILRYNTSKGVDTNMEYPLMEPPFHFKSFESLSKKEAMDYFRWFLGEIPNRIRILSEYFEETSGLPKELLDYTPESLNVIWNWFSPKIKIVPRTKEEIEEEKALVPPGSDIKTYKPSNETLAIAFDIGIYFAETFVRNNKNIEWAVVTKPKSLFEVNRPVLKGFKYNQLLEPRHILYILTLKEIDGKNGENPLYNLYKIWEKDI